MDHPSAKRMPPWWSGTPVYPIEYSNWQIVFWPWPKKHPTVKDDVKYRQVQREVIAEVDKNENELLPAISLSTQHVDFGPIGFDQSVQRNIRLQNTGRVPALYQIKDARESLLNRPGQSKQLLGELGIHITPTKVEYQVLI